MNAILLVVALVATAPFDRPAWSHPNSGCRDTRAQVIADQCTAVRWDKAGCRVTAATCSDPYSGREIATDSAAQAIHVDHVYPAVEAWKRRAWTNDDGSTCTSADQCDEFERFFNDRRNLLAVRARTNAQKGDRMPDEWCPAHAGGRRLAAMAVRSIARAYKLPLTKGEEYGVRAWERGRCKAGAVILGND